MNPYRSPASAPFVAEITIAKILPAGGGLAYFPGGEAAYISSQAAELFDMKTGDTFAALIVPNRCRGSAPWFVHHVSPAGTRIPEGIAGHISAALAGLHALDLDGLAQEVATRIGIAGTPLLSSQVRAVAEALYDSGELNKVLLLSGRRPTETLFTGLAPDNIAVVESG